MLIISVCFHFIQEMELSDKKTFVLWTRFFIRIAKSTEMPNTRKTSSTFTHTHAMHIISCSKHSSDRDIYAKLSVICIHYNGQYGLVCVEIKHKLFRIYVQLSYVTTSIMSAWMCVCVCVPTICSKSRLLLYNLF